MHFTIEKSKSGKTFGIAFSKKEGDKPFFVLKSCSLRERKDGSGHFVSTPSSKMENGEYLQYAYMNSEFSEFITKAAISAVGVAPQSSQQEADVPF